MALKKKIEIIIGNQNVVFPNAYIKVHNIVGNKEMLSVSIMVLSELEGEKIREFEFNFKPSENENALRWDKQAYEHLKTSPEFEDAIDV